MKKRGESDILTGNIIFIMLNLAFFLVIFIFIMTSAKSVFFYEELYAKQVSLLIDSAKPETIINISMANFFEVFEKDIEKKIVKKDDFFRLDSKGKKVTFSFTKGSSYTHNFFSDFEVDYKFSGIFLELTIKEKTELTEGTTEPDERATELDEENTGGSNA
jgi:energy-coupling factor transporter transmembrane protein EcfT